MSKEKYFEILAREEMMVKYRIRANSEEQARRIFKEHGDIYSGNADTKIESRFNYIIDIGEVS